MDHFIVSMMSKEQLGEKAAMQYGQLRRLHIGHKAHSTKRLAPDRHHSTLEKLGFESRKKQDVAGYEAAITNTNLAAKALYRQHHTELYDMALEEMEAEGIMFNFADQHEETTHRFNEEIADVEAASALNGLGAKLIHIRDAHIRGADEVLAAA
jgi:hypothetical protein